MARGQLGGCARKGRGRSEENLDGKRARADRHAGIANSTLEEFHLLARLADGLGTKNIDHRLRQTDFSDQHADPVFPWLGTEIASLEKLDAALIVGSNLRNEVPLLAHRIRKAAVGGARISFLNPREYRYLFPVAGYLAADDMAGELAALVAAAEGGKSANAEQRKIIASLNDGTVAMILLGHLAQRHPAWAGIRALAAKLAGLTGVSLGYIPDGGNAVAGCLAGVLPHRDAGGKSTADAGLDAHAMLASNLSAYLLLGCEPEFDCANGEAARKSLAAADLVVAIGSFASETTKEYADVILPIGSYAESPGTYVNAEGRWQSVTAAAAPVGQSRPAWKVLRVLGNLLDLDGFDYQDSQQVRDELAEILGQIGPDNAYHGDYEHADAAGGAGEAHDVPMYRTDAIVRRSRPLQETEQDSPASPAVVSF
ncbi:MAG: molybdopterin-dependent oxidoreductase [Proteobacteria bacterium]|nr:molybdopterin-dependent oxidoreductase [Pseudomonadota bacterium]